MYNFITELTNLDINIYHPNKNIDAQGVKAIIEWTIELEMREYGVKSIEISVQKVTLYYTEEDLSKEEGEEIEKSVTVTKGITVCEPTEVGTIYPSTVIWDIEKNKLTVDF